MKFIGVLLIIAGICLGLYLGVWVCFIGGIVQIIESCKATPVESLGIAIGICRFLVSGFVGWVSGMIVGLIGFVMVASD